MPDNQITQAILSELAEPIMSASIGLSEEDMPVYDAFDLKDYYNKQVDLVVSGGNTSLESSTIVDVTGDSPEVLRVGRGDPGVFS